MQNSFSYKYGLSKSQLLLIVVLLLGYQSDCNGMYKKYGSMYLTY